MRTIKTAGDDYQRGQMQGEEFKNSAPCWVEHNLEQLCHRYNVARDKLIHKIEKKLNSWVEQTVAVNENVINECRGISSGLGMDERLYFAALFCFLPTLQCTTIGFYDTDNNALIGKTDDLFENELNESCIEISEPIDGFKHIHFHRAATPFTIAGMNQHGLSIAMTGIPGPVADTPGQFSLFGLHTILPNCKNVSQAIDYIKNLKINCYGFSLLMADSDSVMKLIEKTGAGMTTLDMHPQKFYVHTNHILDSDFAKKNPPQAEPFNTNGLKRYNTATSSLENIERNEDGMWELLDIREQQGAICQTGQDGIFTDFRVIFVPQKMKISYRPGHLISDNYSYLPRCKGELPVRDKH